MGKEIENTWRSCFDEAQKALESCLQDSDFISACHAFSQVLIQTYKASGNVFSCGNGGSHCDAMHFAEELTGRFSKDRAPLGALALGDPSHTSCVSNDYGFEFVFERQLLGLGRQGDLLLAISTSGNSENVIKAVQAAQTMGIKTVGLLGKGGGKLQELVDIPITVVGTSDSGRIQEVHIKIIHTAIQTVEMALFPENYL